MDDFGSGYSALDVLNDIHFDLLKFDMRFMQRFDEDDESKIIMTNLVQMTRELGIETVCEGVETKQQADFLREIGCTKLQGYYFCKPIPFEEIVERYRSGRQIGFEEH
jgi:EAL domain-containing protein (putative c-di-GMP-specific phosphodiesterase class I)